MYLIFLLLGKADFFKPYGRHFNDLERRQLTTLAKSHRKKFKMKIKKPTQTTPCKETPQNAIVHSQRKMTMPRLKR
jgi:hypothetical protein